jgi:hypothetical protein
MTSGKNVVGSYRAMIAPFAYHPVKPMVPNSSDKIFRSGIPDPYPVELVLLNSVNEWKAAE